MFDVPLLDFTVGNVTVFVWKKPEFHMTAMETSPYELDGETPLVFIQVGLVEVVFESKTLYKYLYRSKHKNDPPGL